MRLVAGMTAGADSIEGMDLLRDGAMETVFGGVRAPSTLGSFLRSFTWGNVRQLDKAHRGLTAALAGLPCRGGSWSCARLSGPRPGQERATAAGPRGGARAGLVQRRR
jgi:hypothetical protein